MSERRVIHLMLLDSRRSFESCISLSLGLIDMIMDRVDQNSNDIYR
jgi:hypothetical protein